MIQEHDRHQPPKVSLETSSEKAELEKSTATDRELSANIKPNAQSQVLENNAEDRLKAFARLMMVSLTWSLAGLSERK